MSRSSARARRTAVSALIAAAAVVLAGCEGFQIGDRPVGSGQPQAQPTATSTMVETSAPAEPAVTLPPRATPRDKWKVFTDPGKLVSFEIPEAWTVEPIADPGEGFEEGSVHLSVTNPDGKVMAQLHTGVKPPSADCPAGEGDPYTVLQSEAVDVPSTAKAPTSIEPRFVVRLVQGFRFFSSYGITDAVGGAENRACVLSNTVQGPPPIGLYSFGDALSVRALAPEDVGSGTAAYDTIAAAEKYFDSAEFTAIREMILSLDVAS